MTKSGSKRERLNSLKSRVQNQKLGDVTLAEFADSSLPNAKGRLRKSKNVLQEVRRISTSDDVNRDSFSNSFDNEEELDSETISQASKKERAEFEDNEKFTYYPLKIWLLIADYIPPEDVKSFSLICKATCSVINTPFFWIRLYKRYYNKKTYIPKCLSYGLLDYRLGLKQRVVRSLYYLYPLLVKTATNCCLSAESGVGSICLYQWTYSITDKGCDQSKWIYNFKLCNKSINDIFKRRQRKKEVQLNDINYNEESGCCLLKIVLNEFIVLPNVLGMRLKCVLSSQRSTALTFTSAPLSRKPTEAGSVQVFLEHNQKPRLIPWWHPDYWEHGRCCRLLGRA